MSNENLLYNKKLLCFTEVSDFTDFQGVGSDPLYKRYYSVSAVLRTCISDEYKGFLAQPLYNSNEDIIEWYVDKWNEQPRRLVDLKGEERDSYMRIKEATVQHYRNAALKLEDEDLLILGGALKFIHDETIFCFDNKVVLVAWGMRNDTNKHHELGSLMHSIPLRSATPKIFQIRFNPGNLGSIESNGALNIAEGETVTLEMLPSVSPVDGYHFTGWDPNPIGWVADKDTVFTARYEKTHFEPPVVEKPIKEKLDPKPQLHNVQFLAGDFGTLQGNNSFSMPAGSTITTAMIPIVKPKKGYTFTGWNVNPHRFVVNRDMTFTAQYEKKKGWFARIWPWLWKILLALLLLLLLLLLLNFLKKFKRPKTSHGDVEITLYWENKNDLDLYCVDPSGDTIYYGHKLSDSGGILEIDMNAGSVMSLRPVEHIYWPNGAPSGTYSVYVHLFSNRTGQQSSPYTVKVKYGNHTETIPGNATDGQMAMVYSFTYDHH